MASKAFSASSTKKAKYMIVIGTGRSPVQRVDHDQEPTVLAL